jgi:chemotaxis response regulator CheB
MASQTGSVAIQRAIGVGASAGALDALIRLVRGLPTDLEAPILVVLHLAPSGRTRRPERTLRAALTATDRGEDTFDVGAEPAA